MISRDPMVGPVAGAGQRCRGHVERLHLALRRSDGDGRAHAARAARCARVGPHGCRRSDHQHRRPRTSLRISRRALVGELDGGVRRARRRRGSVRDGEGRRRGVLSGARHRDPGRQGFAVDEDELARRRAYAQDGRAAVADRFGVRAGARRASHADAATAHGSRRHIAAADRPRRWPQSPRRLVPGAGVRQPRARRARLRRSRDVSRGSSRQSSSCARRASRSRITIAPTADCSPRSRRWLSPATAASRSISPRCRTLSPAAAVQRRARRGAADSHCGCDTPCARCWNVTASRASPAPSVASTDADRVVIRAGRYDRARRIRAPHCAARGPRRASAWSSCATTRSARASSSPLLSIPAIPD